MDTSEITLLFEHISTFDLQSIVENSQKIITRNNNGIVWEGFFRILCGCVYYSSFIIFSNNLLVQIIQKVCGLFEIMGTSCWFPSWKKNSYVTIELQVTIEATDSFHPFVQQYHLFISHFSRIKFSTLVLISDKIQILLIVNLFKCFWSIIFKL